MMSCLEPEIVEGVLHDRLAVIEAAQERERVNIGITDRGHLQLLQRTGTALGIHDEYRDVRLTANARDRGRSRVA